MAHILLDFLFSWVGIGILVPLGIGIGVGVMSCTPPEFQIAKVCFSISALLLVVGVARWLISFNASEGERILFGLIMFGMIGVLWVESWRWVYRKEASLLATQATENVSKTEKSDSPPFSNHPEHNNPVQYKSLHDLFMADFPQTHIHHTLSPDSDKSYVIEYNVWGDFDTKTAFFSFYLPKYDYTFEICESLIPIYKNILNGKIRGLLEGMIYHRPGDREESWAELVFAGRIYIYHETHMLREKIDTLVAAYKKEGLSPQFRSKDYLIMRNSPLYEQR